jgi:hypothetical protein
MFGQTVTRVLAQKAGLRQDSHWRQHIVVGWYGPRFESSCDYLGYFKPMILKASLPKSCISEAAF